MSQDYEYDVFVSVKNDEVFSEWVQQYFLRLFEAHLKQAIIVACGRQIKGIFYYKKTLKPGDPWPEELRRGIQNSRVAVVLASPEYFYSKWCLTELHSFLQREMSTKAKVVIPVSVHDGEAFPLEVRNLQAADFSGYVYDGAGFRESKLYLEFQDRIKEFAKQVAGRIHDAPLWEDWPIVEKTAPGEEPEVQQQVLKK